LPSLLLLLLFDGSIIKFVPERTRRSDNSAAAQRHGQALSGRLSAARRRRNNHTRGRSDRRPGFGDPGLGTFSLFILTRRDPRSGAYSNNIIYYYFIVVARIDDFDSRFIEISIAVVPSLSYDIRFVIFFAIFRRKVPVRGLGIYIKC